MDEVRASVQYGDLRGTIAIDGWDGLTTRSAGGGCPKGYWPVGFEIYAEPLNKGDELEPTVYVLAVDESILEGLAPDSIRKYAKEHGEVPVFRFRSKMDPMKILKSIKRLSIVLQDKATERQPLKLASGDEAYGEDELE